MLDDETRALEPRNEALGEVRIVLDKQDANGRLPRKNGGFYRKPAGKAKKRLSAKWLGVQLIVSLASASRQVIMRPLLQAGSWRVSGRPENWSGDAK